MPAYEKALERIALQASRLQERLSEEWREGANRRTIAILIFAGLAALFLYTRIIAPPSTFPLNELVEVPEGHGLAEASIKLKEQNVVQSQIALRILVTLLGREGSVRAGDYLFKEPQDLFSVARIVTTGAFGLEPERIRIHEGATSNEIARILSTRLERVEAARFLSKAQPLEGYLFPDTYFFVPNASEETIIETMRQNFDAHLEEVADDIVAFGRPLEEVIIMASLIEREAHKTDDRRMISGVLWNRIERDMLLQVDAAFLYTLGKGTFELTLDDLKSDNPYNTYKHKGLPPGPIGNPSLDSIRAAVTPVKHKYLYYLADEYGTTHYSVTFEEHVAKKRKYLGG
jgi:UPF0755 protein